MHAYRMASQIVEHFRQVLAPAGITIVHPFNTQAYNAVVVQEGHAGWQMPEYNRESTLSIIIGTTGEVWEPFVSHARSHGWLEGEDLGQKAHPNPFDEYIDLHISRALHTLPPTFIDEERESTSARVSHHAVLSEPSLSHSLLSSFRLSPTQSPVPSSFNGPQIPVHHDKDNEKPYEWRRYDDTGSKFVHLLLAAHIAGLAFHLKSAFLCIHPVYGPWFNMRAVITFDEPGPAKCIPLAHPCPQLDASVEAMMKDILGTSRKV